LAQAIELVENKVLSEVDGRDYIRCLAIEEGNLWETHTVSIEKGGNYSPLKHLSANFNTSSFVGLVKDKVRDPQPCSSLLTFLLMKVHCLLLWLTMLTLVKWMYSGVGKKDAVVEPVVESIKKRERFIDAANGKAIRRGPVGTKDAKKFTQVILDYFWTPTGWTDAHLR